MSESIERFDWCDWGMKYSEVGFYMHFADYITDTAFLNQDIERHVEEKQTLAENLRKVGEQLHAANNEIMALRGERDALKAQLKSATRWPITK